MNGETFSTDGNLCIGKFEIPSIDIVHLIKAPESVCENINTHAESLILKNQEQLADNLIRTRRTGWYMHSEPEIREAVDWVYEAIGKVAYEYSSHKNKCGYPSYIINMADAWIAKYREESIVAPHCHGEHINGVSFCLYADIKKPTSLTFYHSGVGEKMQVVVSKGDLLVFPSHLMHFSSDMHEGRTIFAGNCNVQYHTYEDAEALCKILQEMHGEDAPIKTFGIEGEND